MVLFPNITVVVFLLYKWMQPCWAEETSFKTLENMTDTNLSVNIVINVLTELL